MNCTNKFGFDIFLRDFKKSNFQFNNGIIHLSKNPSFRNSVEESSKENTKLVLSVVTTDTFLGVSCNN